MGQQIFGDVHLVHQNNLAVADAFDGFFFGIRPVIDGQLTELAQAVVGQVAGVQRVSVKNHNFHG